MRDHRPARAAAATDTAGAPPDASATVATAAPYDLARTLSVVAHGPGDGTARAEPGAWWWATFTRSGPVSARARVVAAGVELSAWGPGAAELVARAGAVLGTDDDPGALTAHHDAVAALQKRFRGVRLAAPASVWHALVPTVLAQRVTGREATTTWWALVRRLGGAAPGPAGLRLPPSPQAIAAVTSPEWHRLGVERRRADTLRRAAAAAHRLEEGVGLGLDVARRRLRAVTGVGPWTAEVVMGEALGDSDAVPVGDWHLPGIVCWALAGRRRGTDDEMLALLEPYRGQRARVVRLLGLGGTGPARRAPRARVVDITRL